MRHLHELNSKLDDAFEFGYTKHGTMEEKGRAKSMASLSGALRKADKKSPGMAFLKGTPTEALLLELFARKQAYRSQQKGLGNLKAEIPFVGMGGAGKKALKKVQREK